MSELGELWNNFMNMILENKENLIKSPITWILLVLVLAGIYALFDVPEKTRQNGLGNVLRQLLQIILDVTSDLLDLLRSMMGFLQVLQTLLFGKLSKRTLHILTNYAIVYLSAASFVTTLTGLQEVVDLPIAVFISFGIQVSILICSMELQKYLSSDDDNNSPKPIYKYLFANDALKIYEFAERVYAKATEANDKPGEDGKTEDSKGNNKKRKKKKKSNLPRFILISLIAISVLFSSFFSYLFMFEKFVEGNLVYDDHFRAMEVTYEIIEDYSRELNAYRADIADVLQRYNDVVEDRLDLQKDNPSLGEQEHNDKIENLRRQDDGLARQIAELGQALIDMEEGTDQYYEARRQKSDLEDQREGIESELNTENKRYNEDQEFQSRLQAYKSILQLSSFYANPVDLQDEQAAGTGGTGEDIMTETALRSAFVALQQAEAGLENNEKYGASAANQLTEADRIELVNAFENYMSLGRYFSAHNNLLIDFQAVQEEIEHSGDMSRVFKKRF